MKDIIKLKWLIEDYEAECQAFDEMVENWEEHDDPGSDPGLQYEQGQKVKSAYNDIIDFVKTLERKR